MKVAIFVARWLILGAVALASVQAAAQAGDAQGAASASGPQKTAAKKAAKKRAVRKAGQPSAQSRSRGAEPATQLSRDVVFDGSTIHGRYLSAGEATSTVEQEKKMNELIGPRANFNDRLKSDRSNLNGSSALK